MRTVPGAEGESDMRRLEVVDLDFPGFEPVR